MEDTLNYLVIWKMIGDEESHYATPITIKFNLLDADGQFEWIMNEMAKKDMDITVSTTIVELEGTKQGGLVTMGVAAESIHNIFDEGKYLVGLYIVNSEQFEKIKNEI